jgi:hypothetical protein
MQNQWDEEFFGFDSSQVFTGWWLSPTPLKNDGVRQLG